ncbi:MAG: hypothetical protein V3573_12815 [Desulfovibrionaceae bacterium]
MKTYFVLLCLLFISNSLLRIWNIWLGVPPVLTVSHLADISLFGLCLRVSYGAAFNRRFFEPPQVRLIYWGTMLLGIVSVVLRGLGPRAGLPFEAAPLPDLVLWFLSYALFAGPAVLLDRSLREEDRKNNR